jgi:hypothetical protein
MIACCWVPLFRRNILRTSSRCKILFHFTSGRVDYKLCSGAVQVQRLSSFNSGGGECSVCRLLFIGAWTHELLIHCMTKFIETKIAICVTPTCLSDAESRVSYVLHQTQSPCCYFEFLLSQTLFLKSTQGRTEKGTGLCSNSVVRIAVLLSQRG